MLQTRRRRCRVLSTLTGTEEPDESSWQGSETFSRIPRKLIGLYKKIKRVAWGEIFLMHFMSVELFAKEITITTFRTPVRIALAVGKKIQAIYSDDDGIFHSIHCETEGHA